jgi:hypothetical protein
MLNQLATDPALAGTTPDSDLPVNGVYTSALDDWVFWFQDQLRQRGLPVTVDSRIDPLPAVRNSGYCQEGMQGMFYTIAHLNATFRRRFPDKHDHLEAQPEMLGIRDRLLNDDYGKPA